MKFFKKISPKFVSFLIILYLLFTLTGCPSKPTEEIIEKTIEEVTTTEESELKTEEEAEETTREITEETTEEEVTEEKEIRKREFMVDESVEEVLKTKVIPLLEKDFEIRVTKAKFKDCEMDLSYNTRWLTDGSIQKEMFDIVNLLSYFLSTTVNFKITISATSETGKTIKSENSIFIQDRFLNTEISFEEWVEKCIIK